MKPIHNRADIEQAEKALAESLISMRNTVMNTYKVGMVVLVHRGRMKVQVEITGYPGSYHTNPSVIQGFNLKTGNIIKFHWRDVQEILGRRLKGVIVPMEAT